MFNIIARKEIVYAINVYHKRYFTSLLYDPIFNE